MSLLQKSSLCYMFVCYQTFVGISLAKLFAPSTVQHENMCSVCESSAGLVLEKLGKDWEAQDHFQVSVLWVLLLF